MRHIICADCGHPYETNRTNARYCRVCRLARSAQWAFDRKLYEKKKLKVCEICEKEYLSLTSEKHSTCGDCLPRSFKQDASGTCRYCQQHSDRLVHKDVHVCRTCFQNPVNFLDLRKQLLKKVHARRQTAEAAQAAFELAQQETPVI